MPYHQPLIETEDLRIEAPPEEILFICAVLEGYEGVCTATSTPDKPHQLLLQAAPGHMPLLIEILQNCALAQGKIEFLFPSASMVK